MIHLHHVSLIVADTHRSLTFYRDLLGLKVVDNRPDLGYPGAWLDLGAAQIHLLELPNPDPLEVDVSGGKPLRFTIILENSPDGLIEVAVSVGHCWRRAGPGSPSSWK